MKITADDWGLSPEINMAILELARAKKISTVSFMANGNYRSYLLQELLCTDVNFSLHFNLTEGKPLASKSKLHTLIDKDGNLRGARTFFINLFCFQISRDQMKLEFSHQLSSAKAILGRRLIEVDAHHHIHLAPFFLLSVRDLMKEADIQKIRVPSDWNHPPSALLGKLLLIQRRWLSSFKIVPYGYFKSGRGPSKDFNCYLAHPGLQTCPADRWTMRRRSEYLSLMKL